MADKLGGERVEWVDYAKALGILLVVFGHVQRGLFNAGIIDDTSIYLILDAWVYSFHMPLFFFLSGLFFYGGWKKYGHQPFVLGKFDALIYPYVLWSLLQGGTEVLLAGQTNGQLTWAELFSLWQPRAQFWFLYALFFIFIVNSLLVWLFRERWPYISLPLALLTFVLSFDVEIAGVTGAMKNIIYFDVGALLVGVLPRMQVAPGWLLKSMGLVLVCLPLGVANAAAESTWMYVITFLSAVVGIGGIVFLCMECAKKEAARWLRVVGRYSMQIYLMHVLIASGGRIVLQKIGHVEEYWIHLTSGMLLGILVPVLIAIVFDRLGWHVYMQPPAWLSMKRRLG